MNNIDCLVTMAPVKEWDILGSRWTIGSWSRCVGIRKNGQAYGSYHLSQGPICDGKTIIPPHLVRCSQHAAVCGWYQKMVQGRKTSEPAGWKWAPKDRWCPGGPIAESSYSKIAKKQNAGYSKPTNNEWKKVAWFDKSCFLLHRVEAHAHVCCSPGEDTHRAQYGRWQAADSVWCSLGNVLLGNLGSFHSCGSYFDIYPNLMADQVHPFRGQGVDLDSKFPRC